MKHLYSQFTQELRDLKNAYLFRRPVLLFLIFFCVVLVCLKRANVLGKPGSSDPSRWAGERVGVTGVVLEPPEPYPKWIQFVVGVETIRTSSGTAAAQGKILVHVSGASRSFAAPGDRIFAWGLLQKPTAARIPGTFDYGGFLANRGIHSHLFTSEHSADNIGPSGRCRWTRLGFLVKQHMTDVFHRHLRPEEEAVLSGLVVGSRPRFHPKIKRIFTESGTMHILVASGSNVAFVVGLWFLIARILLGWPKRIAMGSSLPAVWGYVLVAGADPPIVRAGAMTSVAIVAYLLAREDRPYQALGLAALGLLATSPNALFEVGFQMSFLTVFGMLYTLPRIDPWWRDRPFLIRWAMRLFSASWAAQIWILPVTLAVFKRFFPIGLVSNMIMIPFAAGGLSAGLLLAALDYIHLHFFSLSPLLSAVGWGIGFYLRLLIRGAQFFADHPGVGLWLSTPGKIWTVGYYLVLLSGLDVRRSQIARLAGLAGICLLATGWILRARQTRPPNQLQLTWLDLGRSLATLLETPEGEKILVLPTPPSEENSERLLRPYLAERGIKKLSKLILTGGASLSTAPFSVGNILIVPLPGSRSGSAQVPLLIQYKETRVLIGKTIGLKAQDALLSKPLKRLDLVQARFSEKAQWREAFVKRGRPHMLIETGFDSERYRSHPPWPVVPLAVPQRLGYYTWEPDRGERASTH